jgi:hypothetical protein
MSDERSEGWGIYDPRGQAHYFFGGREACSSYAALDSVSELHDAGAWPVKHCELCIGFLNELQNAITRHPAGQARTREP